MDHSQEKPEASVQQARTSLQCLTAFLRNCGVETHGIAPIPKENRVDPRTYQHFLLWFSANINLPNMTVGAGGPVVFKLSLQSTVVNLIISDAVACIIPAYFAIFGPKLGMRSMVQARFSWGAYAVVIPSLLNVFSMVGYLILNLIIGGQMLATVSTHLTPNTGIGVIALVSLVACFCGYKTLHWFQGMAGIPTVLGIAVILSLGAKHFPAALSSSYPALTVASTLSFASAVVASDLSWCTMTADYGVYHDAKTSSAVIFTYVYLGIFLPSVIMHVLGAAFAAAAFGVPSWLAAYDHGNNFGGLASAVLEPSGAFGKILMVLLCLAIAPPTALTMYSFGMSLMNVHDWFAKIPRYVFAIIATAICIPVSIVGQTRFYDVLVAIIDLIGYWSASYAGIVIIEHIVFRRADFGRYNPDDWANASKLPIGLAALLSFLGSFALIVPCMAQTFYVGPIAKRTGDIGLLVGFVGACALYAVLRTVEMGVFPARGV